MIDFIHKLRRCHGHFQGSVKDGSLKRASRKDGHEKGRLKKFELCTNVYLMYLCEMTGVKEHIHKYVVFPLLEIPSFESFNWIFVTRFAELIQS